VPQPSRSTEFNLTQLFNRKWWPLLGLLLTNAVIVLPEWMYWLPDLFWLRLTAGLVLLFVLPGLAWLRAFDWFGTQCGIERIVLIGGTSAAISSVALLGALYWPEPLNLPQVLIGLDLITTMGVGVGFALPGSESAKWKWPSLKVAAALLVVLCVAIGLRWYALGYGEFHEDEIENMRLAVRAMKGEEYAPFLDSKGPVHWLLPAALWLMHGWINEAIARLPFVICSTLTMLAVYALGRRMAGPVVGVIGSGLVAVSGLLVAYARHVENPSLIVLWGVLTLWCAYRFYREGVGALQVLGGFFLGVGLVAHPDTVLYLIPFGFMLGFAYWRNQEALQRYWKSLVAGSLLCIILALLYYVPFTLDPNFGNTIEYLARERVGVQILYNRAQNLLELEGDYSTRYYMPLVLLFSSIVFARELRKLGWFGTLLAAFIAAAIVTTLYWPSIWEWGTVNGAFLPYALLLLTLILSPHTSFEITSLTLWFGIPYLALTFLAKDAATHIRNAYPAWLLLAAIGLKYCWDRLIGGRGRMLKTALVLVLACISGLVIYYEYLQFLAPVTYYWSVEADAKNSETSIYRTLYGSLPRPRKLVSNPRLGGWKVVGHLYDTDQLQGDFRSLQESFAVPIWYTYQTPRSCFDDPQNKFVRIDARGLPEDVNQLAATGYGLTRIVRVDGQPKLYLFEKGTLSADEPEIYDVDDYRALYDRFATPGRYIQEKTPEYAVRVTFGDQLLLRGFDIDTNHLASGDTLALTLYWQMLMPTDLRYRAFVHVEGDQIWGQHDDDPICRVPTDELRPSETGAGQFRVTLDPKTPPGTYPITVGIYNLENGERLEIVGEQGQALGNAFELTTVIVE